MFLQKHNMIHNVYDIHNIHNISDIHNIYIIQNNNNIACGTTDCFAAWKIKASLSKPY